MKLLLAGLLLVATFPAHGETGRFERLSVLLEEGFDFVPVGDGFVAGLHKEKTLFLCVVNEDPTSTSLNVRQTLLSDARSGSESLVVNELIPVFCFQAQ